MCDTAEVALSTPARLMIGPARRSSTAGPGGASRWPVLPPRRTVPVRPIRRYLDAGGRRLAEEAAFPLLSAASSFFSTRTDCSLIYW